jgi:glycosyltransferase involved in cell wall biosynthesis
MKKSLKNNRTHCMVVHAYYPLGETRVEREALALFENGFEVDVICLQDEGEKVVENVDGINVYRLPVSRNKEKGFLNQLIEYLNFFIRVFFKLISLQSKKKYQVVQVHNLPDFLVFSAIYPKFTGSQIILDIHDLMPEFYASKTNSTMDSFGVRLVLLQERLSCWFADHVITVTDLWRDRLIDRGVDSKKVSVVMNVADERYFYPREQDDKKDQVNENFHLIYHGTFKEHYGLGELIRSIAYLRNDIPGIRLSIQGVGEYYGEMVKIVEELKLQNEVTINNFAILVNELPDLINQADVGVVPNRNDIFNGDLLPTKMLEYVALGKPVIAARTRVISHYFDETMVRFFEPGDAESLAKAISAVYQEMGQKKIKKPNYSNFTSKYNWNLISQYYVNLVRALA